MRPNLLLTRPERDSNAIFSPRARRGAPARLRAEGGVRSHAGALRRRQGEGRAAGLRERFFRPGERTARTRGSGSESTLLMRI